MNKTPALLLLLLPLASCHLQPRNFAAMSEAELYDYNASVEYQEQVFCSEEVRAGSHLRRRSCVTLGETLGGHVGRLNTASSSVSLQR